MKYTDPDGNEIIEAVILILVASLFITSDVSPQRPDFNIDNIYKMLENTYYDDPAKRCALSINKGYSKEKIKTITLESHPIKALGAALPVGNPTEDCYSNEYQLKGQAIVKAGTIIDGLCLIGSVMENLQEGHLGDVTLTYKIENNKITAWNLTLTTMDPLTGKTSGRQVLSEEDAIKYLQDNKEVLQNDPAFKELENYIN